MYIYLSNVAKCAKCQNALETLARRGLSILQDLQNA